MKMKRAVMIAVLAVAIAALAVPLIGSRTQAAGGGDAKASVARTTAAASTPMSLATASPSNPVGSEVEQSQAGHINPEVLTSLGIRRAAKGTDMQAASQKVAKQISP